MRIGLVGCAKSKRSEPAAARDLYDRSALFRGARCYVERSCERWFILSARYGLVRPEQVIAPYDETLTTLPRGERCSWAERVLGELERELGPDLSGITFEAHAGAKYLDCLVHGIEERGGSVEEPLHGLGRGARRAFYKERGCL